ncbi:MAG: hypothetical protein FJ304_04955 [Planctomycetes bacterium]|nr:hypothetical protein [Planctomycetota bacterium]
MTDPIAVDVPKPSFARSVPGSVPPAALPPLPAPFVPKPDPKPEPKADAAKTEPPAPPPVPSTITPAPPAPDGSAKWLGLFTKKQLTIGASAVFSLAAGIGALRLMFPAKDQPKPATTSSQEWAATPRAEPKEQPKPTAPPTISPDPLPPIPPPDLPFPTSPVARPTGITPVPPPAPSVFPPPVLEPERPKLPPLPPPSGFEPTLPPLPVIPISGTEPKLPALPPLPGAPMVPAVPPPSGLDPIIPQPPGPPKVEPHVTPKVEPVLPPIPAPGGGPSVPVVPPPVFPLDPKPEPKVEPKLPDPFPPVGTPTGFTKPGGTTDPKPFVPEVLPKTNFDVDLYEPRASDTYDSISQEFYNDRRFAAALRAFNRNQALTAVRYVEVPPIHVLRRQFGGQVGAAPSGTGTGAPQWGAADPTPPPAARGRTTFVVPPGGMTMRAVARETLGSDLRWNDIYDLNPQFKPSELIPAGTELKVPPGARVQ